MAVTPNRRDLIAGAFAVGAVAALPAWARVPARFPAPTRTAMVPVEGGRVYVRVNGDLAGPRPPVIVAAGGPGGTHAYYIGLLALADQRAVILYDQLDTGRSDRPQDPANWRVARFVDELDAIRGALDVPRWHVLGHSWGGTIALEYAARRPRALQSVVLASPLVSTRSWIADAGALREQLPPAVRDDLTRCAPIVPPQPAACDVATRAFYAAYNAREPADPAIAAYARTAGGRGDNPELYRAMWGPSEFAATGTLRDYDGEPLLAKLDGARTLFVGGQYDEARPATLAAFAERVPGAELAVVPGAAHGTFSDRPAEMIALLRGWMQRHDETRATR